MKKPNRFPLYASCVAALIFISGLGIGYIYGTNRVVQIASFVVCKFTGVGA